MTHSMKTTYFIIAAACVLGSCQSKPEQKNTEEVGESTPVETFVELPPLESGEAFLKNKDPFGEIVGLTGEPLETDSVIFRLSGPEMIVKEGRFVMKNRGTAPFMQFGLPDMAFLGEYGKMGSGPDEYVYPTLVPTTDPDLLCYVFEQSNQKLYRFLPTGELEYYPFPFSDKTANHLSDKELVNLAPDDFIYVESSATGKSIFRSTRSTDSVATREVYSLGLNPKRKSPFSYIGDFVVNARRDRMAYAYKYFKIIKFMDLEGKSVRTVNFEREEFSESTLYKVNGLDQNVTHYWGACAGEDYVYFLYSGRTPMEVNREWGKKQFYIFVEQYDWNGTPIRTYKLDQWGYFTVDEKNKCLYLASPNYDDPFFVYHL